jgi:uncharacterized protein with gpF-like domain
MLRNPTGKPIKLAPVRANAGLEAAYQKALDRLVEDMHRSLIYWLTAQYRAKEPELATDMSPLDNGGGSPAMSFRDLMRRLSNRWLMRFDRAAPKLAKYFATAAADRSDRALKSILKKGGFSVEFKMTREANDALQASIGEQVSLIKSIASEHLTQVEGIVMRSVTQGRDLHHMREQLVERYGVTKRRAAFIARDQNNKATATMTRVRQQSLGITQAQWVHSGGGKHPRPSHVKASQDRLVYDVSKGAYIDGAWIFPGELPNCRCVAKSIIPGF